MKLRPYIFSTVFAVLAGFGAGGLLGESASVLVIGVLMFILNIIDGVMER